MSANGMFFRCGQSADAILCLGNVFVNLDKISALTSMANLEFCFEISFTHTQQRVFPADAAPRPLTGICAVDRRNLQRCTHSSAINDASEPESSNARTS